VTEDSKGLVVRHSGADWGVYHAPSGLPAATGLRQRRFAEEALTEFLATGVDFTADARAVQAVRKQWEAVYRKWRRRAEAKGFDQDTGEYYPVHVPYGMRVPSAKWAAAWREAIAAKDGEALARLIHDGNKAVREPA
jgi:hypothetical protein